MCYEPIIYQIGVCLTTWNLSHLSKLNIFKQSDLSLIPMIDNHIQRWRCSDWNCLWNQHYFGVILISGQLASDELVDGRSEFGKAVTSMEEGWDPLISMLVLLGWKCGQLLKGGCRWACPGGYGGTHLNAAWHWGQTASSRQPVQWVVNKLSLYYPFIMIEGGVA